MVYVLLALGVVAVIGGFLGSLMLLFDWDRSLLERAAGLVLLVLVIALILWGVSASDDDRPCARWETGTTYDAASKMPRAYTYCAEYGEWTEKPR